MLTIRGLETRLRKLEAKRRPAEGLFYLVWGRDEAEVEAVLARAEAAGVIQRSDPVVQALWPWDRGMPESRWVERKIGTFGRAEFSTLALLIQAGWWDKVEEWAGADDADEDGKALAVELDQRWQGIDVPLARRCPRPAYLSESHDADLILAALGSG